MDFDLADSGEELPDSPLVDPTEHRHKQHPALYA
jgi:hypothetical protein